MVFNCYIEKDLNLEAPFRTPVISWNQQITTRSVKYYAKLQIRRSWVIVCSFIVIYNILIEKNVYIANEDNFSVFRNFCWYQQYWSGISKTHCWCLYLNMVSKCANFYFHFTYSSVVMGCAFLTLSSSPSYEWKMLPYITQI